MKKILDPEAMRLKFRNEVYIPALRGSRRKRLKVADFSIISNNCWGGTVYESFGLQKLTPTAGMFIMPDDYLELVSDLDGYLSAPLEFIQPQRSKWRTALAGKKNWGTYLIGRIGEIELHMLHYHDETSARRKWEARCERVNPQKLIFKFNDQNGATQDHLQQFDNLNLENKIQFTVHDFPQFKSAVYVRSPSQHDYVRASYEPIGRKSGFNVTEYINSRFEPST